jgi:Calcineurin-like phosphoesterase.
VERVAAAGPYAGGRAHIDPVVTGVAVYAVGDIQGCYEPLNRLLERVKFDPSRDVLWCTGDLVNRGPASLEVLRFLVGSPGTELEFAL